MKHLLCILHLHDYHKTVYGMWPHESTHLRCKRSRCGAEKTLPYGDVVSFDGTNEV